MKPITRTFALSLALVSACSVSQTIERGVSEDAPVPDEAMARHSRVSLAVLQNGHGIYMRKCGECHTHLLPDQVTSKEWHVVVPGMAWNSGIAPDEESALLDYLIAARMQTEVQNTTHPPAPGGP
jgi:hypothetical protein